MNTINDKHHVAFGLKYSLGAKDISQQANKLGRPMWVLAEQKFVPSKAKQAYNFWENHSQSNDLLLDIIETNNENGRYLYKFSFSKGSLLKRDVKDAGTTNSLVDFFESISENSLEKVRNNLINKYSVVKAASENSNELKKIAKDKKISSRFADGTAQFIPKLNMQASDFKSLVERAPERFTFELRRDSDIIIVNSKNYPQARYKVFNPQDFSSSSPLLEFEEKVLKPAHILKIKHFAASAKLDTALARGQGLGFYTGTYDNIFKAGLSPEQIDEFTKLAERETSKGLFLHVTKNDFDSSLYDAIVRDNGSQVIGYLSKASDLKTTIEKVLSGEQILLSFEKRLKLNS